MLQWVSDYQLRQGEKKHTEAKDITLKYETLVELDRITDWVGGEKEERGEWKEWMWVGSWNGGVWVKGRGRKLCIIIALAIAKTREEKEEKKRSQTPSGHQL